MNNKREFANIETSKDVGGPGKDREPMIQVPMAMVRWLAYSTCFAFILAPGFWEINYRGVLGASYVLGWFASQLNALINKKQ